MNTGSGRDHAVLHRLSDRLPVSMDLPPSGGCARSHSGPRSRDPPTTGGRHTLRSSYQIRSVLHSPVGCKLDRMSIDQVPHSQAYSLLAEAQPCQLGDQFRGRERTAPVLGHLAEQREDRILRFFKLLIAHNAFPSRLCCASLPVTACTPHHPAEASAARCGYPLRFPSYPSLNSYSTLPETRGALTHTGPLTMLAPRLRAPPRLTRAVSCSRCRSASPLPPSSCLQGCGMCPSRLCASD